MTKVYPNTFYMDVWEKFIRADGDPSYYSMISGDGYARRRLFEDCGGLATKDRVKQKVDEILRDGIPDIDTFSCVEVKHGWNYERCVRHQDDDCSSFDIVKNGEHTDHEQYTVEIVYIDEDVNAMSKLK